LLTALLQVPQFLLEDAVLSGAGSCCSVIVTQPRRIAAISVADRVAVERGERGEARGWLSAVGPEPNECMDGWMDE
jgi:ATP-dependent RNA helicase DHX29